MAERGKALGMGLTSLSAVLFGLMPVGASWIYAWGGDPVTLTFYRNLMVVPVLLAAMKAEGISFRTTRREAALLLLVGIGFRASTTLMLYQSYLYIPTGVATTLHFLYPIFTALIAFFLFKERLVVKKCGALACAAGGVACFAGGSGGGFIAMLPGLILALASAVTYSGYLTGMDHTALRDMNATKVSCYMGLSNAAAVLLINIPARQIHFALPPKALLYTFIISICTSFVAFALLQLGIRELGAATASIFCLLEPLTSVISGCAFLGEAFSVRKLLGCLLVLGAVVLVLLSGNKRKAEIQPDGKGNGQ